MPKQFPAVVSTRVDATERRLIESAAHLGDQSVSAFVRQVVVAAAEQRVQDALDARRDIRPLTRV